MRMPVRSGLYRRVAFVGYSMKEADRPLSQSRSLLDLRSEDLMLIPVGPIDLDNKV